MPDHFCVVFLVCLLMIKFSITKWVFFGFFFLSTRSHTKPLSMFQSYVWPVVLMFIREQYIRPQQISFRSKLISKNIISMFMLFFALISFTQGSVLYSKTNENVSTLKTIIIGSGHSAKTFFRLNTDNPD